MRIWPITPGLASFVLLLPLILPVQPRSIPNGATSGLHRRFLRSFFRSRRPQEVVQSLPSDTGAEPDPDTIWPTFYSNRRDETPDPHGEAEVTKHIVHEERFDPFSFWSDHGETRGATPDTDQEVVTGRPSEPGHPSTQPLHPEVVPPSEVLQDVLAYTRSLRQAQPAGPLSFSSGDLRAFSLGRRRDVSRHATVSAVGHWGQWGEDIHIMDALILDTNGRDPTLKERADFERAYRRALQSVTDFNDCVASIFAPDGVGSSLSQEGNLFADRLRQRVDTWNWAHNRYGRRAHE